MTQLTMGQRIAAQRKLKGLSQEALSEQLDVSRQAISKWESDGAIPEVDKLIALGRIFGVSVGWLLGTESECRYDPDAGLNDAQRKMVEEIAARYQPPKRARWKTAAAALCIVLAGVLVTVHYQGRIDDLAADNVTTQTQLAELVRANGELQAQVEQMNAILESQESAGALLRDYGITGYASDDLSEMTITFVLTPKVYQEAVTARLSITHPDGYAETLDCRWNGAAYLVRATFPLEDGYEFRFLLLGEDSYQEELLNSRDPYLSSLKTHSVFTIDPADPQYGQLRLGESAPWDIGDTTYTFQTTLYPPFTRTQDGYSYRDIFFTLYLNDAPVWQQSWKEEFLNAYGYHRDYALPVTPDISVDLPELAAGDELRLEITAELTNGQTLTSILDRLTVTGGADG